jgi:molybdopterin molybdotransferase
MITIEQAEKILNSIAFEPETEETPLTRSLGRILAQDIVSRISMPPFDKSAMDGYALRSSDNSPKYKIVEVIAAGSVPAKKINTGQCAAIMTGAMVPDGADRVIKIEVTQEKDGYMTITGQDRNPNICYLGEDVKPGDILLKAGHLIRPPEVGIIASMGFDRIHVYKKPTVGIITTGSEIKEPGGQLEKGQIYNSNAYSIGAQALQTGAAVEYAGIVSDDPASMKQKIGKLLDQVQMLLISGGVSMGEFDYVPAILQELGVRLHFEKVAIQPGKPTVFGTRGSAVVFGMPGNPVSTFTIFEVFVKTVLYRMMGYSYRPLILQGVMKADFKRKRGTRTAYVPVTYSGDGLVQPVEYHGSAHLSALSQANALLKVPSGITTIEKGQTVHVRHI